MDFIEKIFGFSPDGGDGSTELMYVMALIVGVAVTAAYLVWRRRVRRDRSRIGS